MKNIRKWCYNTVQGLGIICLWVDFGVITQELIGSYAPGIIVGLLFIGWSLGYEDEKD